MDTEALSQRLNELQTLLNRLEQGFNMPAPEKEIALQAFLQHFFWIFEADDVSHQDEQDTQERLLLNWLLKIEKRLLVESQQHLALLEGILKNSPSGLAVITGPNLIFRIATETYRRMLPSADTDIIGLSYEDVWPLDHGPDGSQLIRQMLISGKNLQFERFEQAFPDGLVHSFSLRICRMDWHGESGALLMMQETTQADRARTLAMEFAEESHRQAEELDAIIMAMAEAVTIFNAQGAVTRANPASVELFRFDPVQIDRLDLIDLLGVRYPDGSPIPTEDLFTERALHGETTIGQRILLVDQNSNERVVHVSASPLFNETVVTAVVTVWHDVTERERLLEQLEVEQARLETIITNAPEAILVVDEEGRLVLSNPAGENFFGRPLPYHEAFESLARLQIYYDDGTPCIPRNFPLVCSALDGERFNNQEMLIHLPDRKVSHILTSTAPIVDRKGNVNGAVGVFQDITQRKQAEEALRRQASRSQMLAMLSRAFAETGLHFTDLLKTITQEVGRVFGDVCSLHLVSEDGEQYNIPVWFTENAGFLECLQGIREEQRFPVARDLTGQVFESGQPALLNALPLAQAKSVLAAAYHLLIDKWYSPSLSIMVIPLRAHGRRIGSLNIFRIAAHDDFSREDQTFLQDLADRAALSIDDTKLFELEKQRARELQALNMATTALLSTIDLENLLDQIMESAALAIPAAQQGILYLLNEKENRLEVRATFGSINPAQVIRDLQEHAERAARETEPMILQTLCGNPGESEKASAEHWSAIIAPLYLTKPESQPRHAGNLQQTLGVLALFGPHPGLFTENDLRLLTSFAATATAALQNARLYAEVQRLAITDTVTGQYSRRKFFELGALEMHRFHRFHTPLSAIMLDLDNFKVVNDTYGHAAGDQVLRIVAQRCRATIRVVDILGRYGGDEFVILLPGAEQREALEIAERLRSTVTANPIQTERGAFTVSISLGIAQASPDMENVSALLGKADTALYQAKQSGRNRVVQD